MLLLKTPWRSYKEGLAYDIVTMCHSDVCQRCLTTGDFVHHPFFTFPHNLPFGCFNISLSTPIFLCPPYPGPFLPPSLPLPPCSLFASVCMCMLSERTCMHACLCVRACECVLECVDTRPRSPCSCPPCAR